MHMSIRCPIQMFQSLHCKGLGLLQFRGFNLLQRLLWPLSRRRRSVVVSDSAERGDYRNTQKVWKHTEIMKMHEKYGTTCKFAYWPFVILYGSYGNGLGLTESVVGGLNQ